MISLPVNARPFGRNCMGNASGYELVDANGDVVHRWVADLYVDGSHRKARDAAIQAANALNRRVS